MPRDPRKRPSLLRLTSKNDNESRCYTAKCEFPELEANTSASYGRNFTWRHLMLIFIKLSYRVSWNNHYALNSIPNTEQYTKSRG
jgi:hypothetical protein